VSQYNFLIWAFASLCWLLEIRSYRLDLTKPFLYAPHAAKCQMKTLGAKISSYLHVGIGPARGGKTQRKLSVTLCVLGTRKISEYVKNAHKCPLLTIPGPSPAMHSWAFIT
jgi:hypothetical protein